MIDNYKYWRTEEKEDNIDFSAPLYDLMPSDVIQACRGKVVDQVSWAAKPVFCGGAEAVFRDATPLALAFAWLEPYRALTNIAIISFTDGTMLRIRRGKFLEMKKDEDIFSHEPCITQVRAHAPILIRGGMSTEIMMRPFPNTWWLVRGSMLMGPPIGIQQPNAQAKADTLMAYGVTKVVMLQFSQEEGKTFEGMEETIIRLGERTKARGWNISLSWNIINGGKEETNAHAGKVFDAILAARPDYGMLYVCVDSTTMEYIAWLWRRYYKLLAVFIRPEDLTENPRIPSSLTLYNEPR